MSPRLVIASIAVLVVGCGAESPGPDASTAADWAVTPLPSPAAPGSGQAQLATTPAGAPVLSWLEPGADGARILKFAVFDGLAWSAARTVASGANWFVNWADMPSVVPITVTRWIAHWLVLKPEQPYAYDIAYSVSNDGGAEWSAPKILNGDGAIAEHGFVTFFPWAQDIGAIWLDGSAIAALTIDELIASESIVGMTLQYARIGADGSVRDRGEIDELVCDCCQTDVAVASDGPVIVYRDRTQHEQRDIVVRRVESTGFTAALRLGDDGWIIDGCPVNGPAIAASGSDVGAAWFTAADNAPRVRFARSSDGGVTFSTAVDVASSGAFGQVDVVLLEDARAIVSWWQRGAEGGMNLVSRPVDAMNGLGQLRVIAQSDEPLPVDVPQMQRFADTLVFAWSTLDGEAAGVHTAIAPVW